MDTFLKRYWQWVVALMVIFVVLSIPDWQLLPGSGGKAMTVRVLSKQKITEPTDTFNDPKITARLANMEEPYHLFLEFSNLGHETILPADFKGPTLLTINNAKIEDLEYGSLPQNMDVTITRKDTLLDIGPAVFHPGDAIYIRFLTSGGEPDVSVQGAIAGVNLRTIDSDTGVFGSLSLLLYLCLLINLSILFFLALLIGLYRGEHFAFIKTNTAVALLFCQGFLSIVVFTHLYVLEAAHMLSSTGMFLATCTGALLIAWKLASNTYKN